MRKARVRDGREAKKLFTEQQVLEHATKLFAAKGFDGTSLQDIADAMGLTRGAIYYYFENKEALLAALVEEVTIGAARDIDVWRAAAQGSPSERLRALVRQRALYVLERGPKIRVLELAEAAVPRDLAKRHREAKRRILEEYSSIIRQGILKGEFVAQDDRVAAFAIIGMMNWTAWWFDPTRGRTAEQIAEQLADMAVKALARRESAKVLHLDPVAALNIVRENLDLLEMLINERGSVRDQSK
jgi:AcrR family transcriptional regulator